MSGSILVVDDDTKVLEILNETLTRNGHNVFTAQNGEEALRLYKDEEPDMLIVDVMLPDMDGRDVLQIVRSIPSAKTCPILFLSASDDPDLMASVYAKGGDDFLTKPFSLREFNAKINRVLGSYESKRELEQTNIALEEEVSEKQESYVQMNRELKRQLLSMKTLFAVSQDLNRRLDLDGLINGLALTLMGELGLSSMAVFALRREKDDSFELVGVKGFDRKRIADLELKRKSEFSRWLVEEAKPLKIVRESESRWVHLPDLRLAIFQYVTPIVVKQNLRGVVFTGPKISGKTYSPYEMEILHSVCNSAGTGMDNARLFRELQNTYLSTVKALVSIIEAKDSYTRGHTERVADYSVALGAKLRLPRELLRDIAFGAVLHDIGKLLVYEKILNKPGSLNEEEWEVLKQHPEIGASIIENMEFLAGTVPLVKHHHENYDGSGYPDGLKEEDIPIGARIISVADSFDAMTTDRSYRKAMPTEKALTTLEMHAGSQFDPVVVETFCELIRVDGFEPRQTKGDSIAQALTELSPPQLR